uniref:Putative pbp/gobp family n=1 Tax=Aedes albopictus TaxID=7160 RepID=A0A023EGC3_AEDAL
MATHRCLIAAALLVLLVTLISGSDDATAKRKQYDHNKLMCSKIVRSTKEQWEGYQSSQYPETHETACFMRCVSILSGSYDDETGVNVDVLFETFGKGMTAEEYAEESKPCLALRDEVECYCMKAFKPLMCMREQYKKRNTA